MSQDIRKFFQIANASKKEEKSTSSLTLSKAKRKVTSLSSDDEKEPPVKTDHKKKRRILDSDDEEEKPKKDHRNGHGNINVNGSSSKKASTTKEKTWEKKNLVEVDVSSMFGNEPVKRKERPKIEKLAQKADTSMDTSVINIDDDDDDTEMMLIAASMQLETSKAGDGGKTPEKEKEFIEKPKSSEKKRHEEKISQNLKSKATTNHSEQASPSKKRKHDEPASSANPKDSSAKKRKDEKLESLKESPKKSGNTPSRKKEKQPKEMTAEDDEARHERRQAAAALYHQMKNRPASLNHGCKEIPKGKPGCLKGLQFVISGVLESMEREEAAELIKSCGGNVVSGLSKKVTHLLVGAEAGPAKVAKAEDMGIKQFSEDDLLRLIRKKSGLPDVSVASVVEEEEPPVLKDSPGKENRKTNQESSDKKELSMSSSLEKKDVKKDIPKTISMPPPKSVQEDFKDLSFVDKYKPTTVKQIIGQQGPSSNTQKLMNWLSKWHINNDGKKKHAKSNPWAKDNDGSSFKAALLSGSPGVGKTTTAHLVSKELLYDIVEFNASDTRSKKLLKEEVASLISNKSLAGYLSGTQTKVSKRHVLIMDEVDGMAGNEDRGGVAELIALIKESQIPIICMCNDRNHPKIRSLANYCFDLRFHKPSVNQIRGAMMSICFKEGIKLEAGAIDEIIGGTGNDIRQTLNHLALYSASKDTKLALNDAKKNAQMSEKDVKIGQFDVIRKVFSADEHKKMSFNDKSDLFFHDYNMASLFVQENYLRVKPNCSKSEVNKRVAMAADALSLGDLVERKIRSSQAWSLLPTQAIFSSVLPGEYMEGNLASVANFPGWLGKNSKTNKRKRLAQELHDHTRIATSGSRLSVRLDYAPFLVQAIVKPLKEKGLEGVSEALEVIKEYRLLREDIDSLLELTTWPKMKNPWESIDSKVKAALTRAYNKEVQPYSYSVVAGVKKKASRAAAADDDFEDDEGAAPLSDEEEDDTLENNAFIKIKKPTTAKEPKAGTSKASSAKAGGTSKASKSKSKK